MSTYLEMSFCCCSPVAGRSLAVLSCRNRIRAAAILPHACRTFSQKALREGKRHSTWETPNVATEGAAQQVIAHWLQDTAFLRFMEAFDAAIQPQAMLNSIRMTVLKCTAPGSPDVYQGAEYGEHSLVDPDNRRLIDYPARELSLVGLGPRRCVASSATR